jgi:RNA polymerase sigma-70 factor (ECF subfamily)
MPDLQFCPGIVDGRPAVLVMSSNELSRPPAYFILLEWSGDSITKIRDFAHARYAMEGADVVAVGNAAHVGRPVGGWSV